MIMAACLASVAFADAPADITNPSFEEDTAGICDAWTESADNYDGISYITGDAANANFGDDYYQVQNVGSWGVIHTALGEEVAVTAGSNYDMVLWARTATEATGTVGLKFEFYATSGEGWVEGSTPFAEEIVDITGDYQQFTLTATIPAGMNYARGVLITPFEQPGAAVYVDDMWISQFPIPCDPVACGTPLGPNPANGSIQSALNAPAYGHLPVTQLSWSFYSPNTLGVRVRFEKEPTGVYDPNWTSGVYTALANDAQTVDLSTLTTLPLDDDSLYSWQVETTDSSRINGDWVVEGNVWLFHVGCPYDIVGDVDNNCLVNLVDVSMMAANWLIDCINDPADPACIVP